MKIEKTPLEGVLIVEPDIFNDSRGFFMETYQAQRYQEGGIDRPFVQDNLSFSVKGTLRGLHFQYPHAQAKLVQVVQGEVFDAVIDIRVGSPTFGEWFGTLLSNSNNRQLFIPEGFAHGFVVMSDTVVFTYKCSDFYTPQCEGGIIWNDPAINIDWPLDNPLISEKDCVYPCLKDIPAKKLPEYGRFN